MLERHDPFCGGCHLPPETAFVERSMSTTPVDLAAAHALSTDGERVQCVDCHGGPGLGGKIGALRTGARDLASWLQGDFVVVGTEYMPLGGLAKPLDDGICAACHGETLQNGAFDNHFHALLDDEDAPPDLRCTACHEAHVRRPDQPYFLTEASVAPGCERCHDRMGGPTSPFR
jgi:hypothetical protein